MESTSLTLLERARDLRDADAWAKLLALYTPLLTGWLRTRGLQPADVDDLSQRALAVVAERLPSFEHNSRPGAFRAWLRAILANVIREFARHRPALGMEGWAERLDDGGSELARRWDSEHDSHILRRLLESAEPEFSPKIWQAFRRTALDEEPASAVAKALGISVNAVLLARSRVLAHLRAQARGLVEV